MTYEASNPLTKDLVNFKAAFESIPGAHVLLLPDAPKFTILTVTDDHIAITGRNRKELVGLGLFEAFPPNPADFDFSGESNLSVSFKYVIEHKADHRLAIQRYDIRNEAGAYEERYWSARNKPVLDENGEVLYIIHSSVDITDEIKVGKHAESLRGIEKAYNLFMQAPVIIAIVKGDDNIIELANEGMLQIWGRGKEVIGKPLLHAIPELKDQGIIELLDKVKKTGEPFYAYENPTKIVRNGIEETRYFDFVYHPYYEHLNDNEANGVFGVAHDVTEQVLGRKKLAEATERLSFRNALFEAQNEATPDGVLIVDAKGRTLLHNKRFVEIWQMPQEIIDSKNDDAALKHAMTMLVDPQGFIDRVGCLYNKKEEKSYDLILFKDGRVIERNGTPILAENGLYYGWAWYFRDISDRIKQEQKFKNVVEQAPNPILILMGEELVLEVANEALFDLWQVGPEAINKPFLQILPEMKDQVFVGLLQNVLRTGEPFFGTEVPAVFKRKDGTEETRYVNFSYQPFKEANGRITGVLVIANDVTGQVLAKQKLVESERNFRNMILQSPVATCILRGPEYVIEIANDRMFELMGRKAEEVLNKPQFEALPEIKGQGLEEVMLKVYTAGETFTAHERPVPLMRNGRLETTFVNFVYEPFRESDGSISAIIAVAIDVTAQVKARKQIEESEQDLQNRVEERTIELVQQSDFLNSVLDASINGVLVLDAERDDNGEVIDFRIVKINKAFTDIVRLDEAILGKRYSSIFPDTKNTGTFELYKEVMRTGVPARREIYSKDQNLNAWFDISVGKRGDNGIVLTFTNISTQRKAAILIEEQKNLLDSILKSSPSGITVYKAIRNEQGKTQDFQCIIANETAEKFTQIANKERLTKSVLQMAPEMRDTPLFNRVITCLEENKPFQTQYYHKPINRWLELSIVKMDSEHLINVFADITTSKETQLKVEEAARRLSAVFNAAQSGMFTFSPVRDDAGEIVDFRFTITNKAFAAYVKQTPEVLNGELGSTWFPGYLTNGVFDMYKRTFNTGETQRIDIHYNVDGHDIYLDLMSTKTGDEVLVTFTDYTELKKAQVQLEQSVEELKQANSNLQEFAYAASHDLKEPVRKTHIFLDRLKASLEEKINDEEKRYLERITQANKRMISLIDDLLAYSDVSMGTAEMEKVDLNKKIQMVLEDLELQIQEKEAKITFNKLPTISGHKRQIQQLFQNLIGNALKYNKKGTIPEVNISSSVKKGREVESIIPEAEANTTFNEIIIKDNGIGFEQEDAERIFRVFQRLHNKGDYEGTGVGLAIVQRVVKNHRGYITAESELGKGATFKIYLPAD